MILMWATQGGFSGLLHLVAVVLAGAMAFGLQEHMAHMAFKFWLGADGLGRGAAVPILSVFGHFSFQL